MNFIKNLLLRKEKNRNLTTENSEPKILYKYRDWNNIHHKKSIKKNQIYFASPNLFNDPFDCKMSKNFTLLNTEEKKLRYVTELIREDSENLSELDIQKSIKQKLNEFKDIKKYQALYEKKSNKLHNNQVGILSLSKTWNSILMWSHYSNFHQGFCVGYDAELLKNPMFGKFKNVKYSKEFPNYEPKVKITNELLNMPFLKNKDWEYEQEYRFMQLFPNPVIGRVTDLSDDFIKEVNLGLSIPEKHKNEIIKIAKGKNWKIYQLYKATSKFELSRKEL